MLLTGAYAAPEVAFRAEPVAHQHHKPDLQVAPGVLVPGNEKDQQKGQQRKQQSQRLARNAVVTEYGQVLSDGATDATADQ